jgi:hypothetical protein
MRVQGPSGFAEVLGCSCRAFPATFRQENAVRMVLPSKTSLPDVIGMEPLRKTVAVRATITDPYDMTDRKMTKTVGEHWVCATLARHGWAPALTRDGLERVNGAPILTL